MSIDTNADTGGLDIDLIVERLTLGQQAWAQASLAERREVLLAVASEVSTHAEEWVRVATAIKQLDPSSPLVGEEWISGPYATISAIQALAETLRHLAAEASPLAPYRVKAAPGGRLSVPVLPHNVFDRLLLSGFAAEVWTTPGISEQALRASAGLGQLRPETTNGIGLVLGAGNIFSIAPLDVLYQLFAHNRAVVLKLNPVTDPLHSVLRAILHPLIARNMVEIVTGGPALGSALTSHPGIAAVHMTGSEATHDAIVWGTGDDTRARRAAGTPRLAKPITSELGGVAPIIVLPGQWSKADIRFQAEHVATQRLHNSGCNCIAGQILIVSESWPQKDEFLEALRHAFKTAPHRPGWYPGTEDRVTTARALHPSAEAVGGTPLRTLLTGLDLTDPAESAFTTEYFGPVLGIAELPGTGADFLATAVEAANDRLHGTLGANIIGHPKTIRRLGERFTQAVADLRYGTIAINAWTGVGYLTPQATWGAFPDHTLEDIQSGIGVVHNALLLDHVERTVVTGPFRASPRSLLHGERSISPKPPWFVTNKTAAHTGRLLTDFAARPRWRSLPAIIASALHG